MRAWTLIFAALTAALGLALVRELRMNRRLRDDLVAMTTAKAHAAGLAPGAVLAPFALRDAAGHDVHVDFAGDVTGTLLLFHAADCDACSVSGPFWRSAVQLAARPDVRVLAIQTDTAAGGPQSLEGLPASLSVPLPPVGWLATLPAVPATIVLDDRGAIVQSWYGEMDAQRTQELVAAMSTLAPTGSQAK